MSHDGIGGNHDLAGSHTGGNPAPMPNDVPQVKLELPAMEQVTGQHSATVISSSDGLPRRVQYTINFPNPTTSQQATKE